MSEEKKAKKEDSKEPVLALRRFKNTADDKIYEKGDDITHLGEERIAELKQKGFVANDKS